MSRMLRSFAIIAAAFLAFTVVPSARAADPFGATACPGVRPGAWMEAPRGTVYTMGFMFKGVGPGAKSGTYMTTVGNFVLPVIGKKTWKPNAGPAAYDGVGKPFGRFVYAYHSDTPEYSSFGLVQIDKKIKTNPQVCHFGGPTKLLEATAATPTTAGYYGNGFPIDQVTPARTAVLTNTSSDESSIGIGLISAADSGDAGAPFVADGQAFGYWDGGIGVGGSGAGFIVARLGRWITLAEKAVGIKLTLLTAKAL